MISGQLFAAAYAGGFPVTVRFLVSRGATADEAEDVAQTAWVRGWEARGQLHSEARVLQWVNSIAFRAFCNEKRRARRHTELSDTADSRSGAASWITKVDIRSLLDKCSKLDRSLLVHRFFGFTTEQTARLHGLSEIATRVRIHRSRKAMQEHVAKGSLEAA